MILNIQKLVWFSYGKWLQIYMDVDIKTIFFIYHKTVCWKITTLIMVYIVGHYIELKTLGINIISPCCELQYFYWFENNVYLRGFQLMVIHFMLPGEFPQLIKNKFSYTIWHTISSWDVKFQFKHILSMRTWHTLHFQVTSVTKVTYYFLAWWCILWTTL